MLGFFIGPATTNNKHNDSDASRTAIASICGHFGAGAKHRTVKLSTRPLAILSARQTSLAKMGAKCCSCPKLKAVQSKGTTPAPGLASDGQMCSTLREYVDKESLLRILRSKSVRLLKPNYLINLCDTGKIIPRRQEVPEEAFLDVDILTAAQEESLEVLSISYCWITKDHPDPEGYHLATLTRILNIFEYQGAPKTNSDFQYYVDREYYPRSELLSRGFVPGSSDGRPVGIFLDWACLFQTPRTEEENKVFKTALENINIWYAHQTVDGISAGSSHPRGALHPRISQTNN